MHLTVERCVAVVAYVVAVAVLEALRAPPEVHVPMTIVEMVHFLFQWMMKDVQPLECHS